MGRIEIYEKAEDGCIVIRAFRKGRVRPGATLKIYRKDNLLQVRTSRWLVGKSFNLDKVTNVYGRVKVTTVNSCIIGTVKIEFLHKHKFELLEAIEPIVNGDRLAVMKTEIESVVSLIKKEAGL